MFGLFSRSIVDEEQEDWILQQYEWLEENIGFPNGPVPLILPTTDYFSPPPEDGHKRAEHIFGDVKKLMGMEEWPCSLRQQEHDIDPKVGEYTLVQNIPVNPLGTFSVDENDQSLAVITYNPRDIMNPEALIATFAHELSHYVLLTCDNQRLGTHEDEEFLTDLMAIASGFGLFVANSRFNFRQFGDSMSQGWQSFGAGYLSESEIIFALSIFCRKYDHDYVQLEKYLKSNLFKLLEKSNHYLSRSHIC